MCYVKLILRFISIPFNLRNIFKQRIKTNLKKNNIDKNKRLFYTSSQFNRFATFGPLPHAWEISHLLPNNLIHYNETRLRVFYMHLQALCIFPKLYQTLCIIKPLEDQCILSRASLDSMYYQFSTSFVYSLCKLHQASSVEAKYKIIL